MGDDRPPAYYEDGRVIFRASALGSACEAFLARALAGHPGEDTPAFMQTKFDEGKDAEPKILNLLHKRYHFKPVIENLSYYGKVQEDGQIEVELDLGPLGIIRCHPDAIVTKTQVDGKNEKIQPLTVCIAEVKALSPGMAKRWAEVGLEVVASYKMQVAIEMLCLAQTVNGVPKYMPLVYGVGVKDEEGRFMAEDLHLKFFFEPPISKGAIVAKVARIRKMAQDLEDGLRVECNASQYPCPYYQYPDTLCGTRKEREQFEASDKERNELVWAAARIANARRKAKKAREEEDEGKEVVRRLCEVGETTAGRWKITREEDRPGNVSWKDTALDLRNEIGMEDEAWCLIQEEHRGKDVQGTINVTEVAE